LVVGLLVLFCAVPCGAQASPTAPPPHPAIAFDAIRWNAPSRLGHRWRRVVASLLGAFQELTRLPPPPAEDDIANPFLVAPTTPVATGGDARIHLAPRAVTLGPASDGRVVDGTLPGIEVRLPWRTP
jgi:hypothetical protein